MLRTDSRTLLVYPLNQFNSHLGVGVGNSKCVVSPALGLPLLSADGFLDDDTSYTMGISMDLATRSAN
jgi:hypothetical protein